MQILLNVLPQAELEPSAHACAEIQPWSSIAALMRRKSIRSFDTRQCAQAISPVSSYEAAVLTWQLHGLCHSPPSGLQSCQSCWLQLLLSSLWKAAICGFSSADSFNWQQPSPCTWCAWPGGVVNFQGVVSYCLRLLVRMGKCTEHCILAASICGAAGG